MFLASGSGSGHTAIAHSGLSFTLEFGRSEKQPGQLVRQMAELNDI
jgi:hypothetical protein